MFASLGQAFAEAFNDPELQAKAKELGEAATASATRLGQRFKDEDVKVKFRQAGLAAEEFGRAVSEYFKSEHKSPPPGTTGS
jgi:hypothetical protein